MTTISAVPETAGAEPDASVLELLNLVATRKATTRGELAAVTGLSRATVSKRLQPLLDAQLISEEGTLSSSGGRPSRTLLFNKGNGVAVGVDVGENHTRVAITDLAPHILVEGIGTTDLSAGPEAVLTWVTDEIARLLGSIDRPASDMVGICLALPAPVDWADGVVVGPSVMTGWDGFDISGEIRRSYDAPVIIDNDVNLLGLCEFRRHERAAPNLLYVKVGTGIGSAIFIDGKLYRGAFGTAGDIGHIHLHSEHEHLCRCGNLGCLESLASGWAIARDLRTLGIQAVTARDVVHLAEQGTPEAIRLLREAGRALGEAIAATISILNPEVLVLGGVLAQTGDHMVSGVREIIYRRSLPTSAANLQIVISDMDGRAGVLGAAQLVVDRLLGPMVDYGKHPLLQRIQRPV